MKYLRTGFSQMKYDLASHGRSLYLPPTYIAAQFSLPPALFGSFAQFLQEIKKKNLSHFFVIFSIMFQLLKLILTKGRDREEQSLH